MSQFYQGDTRALPACNIGNHPFWVVPGHPHSVFTAADTHDMLDIVLIQYVTDTNQTVMARRRAAARRATIRGLMQGQQEEGGGVLNPR